MNADQDRDPHPLEGYLEGPARDYAAAPEYAWTSMAISLKRIADTLERALSPQEEISEDDKDTG